VKPVIVRRCTDHGLGLGRVRWVVKRTFAWLHNFRRLPIRWERDAGLHDALLSLGCLRDLLVPHPDSWHGGGRCSYAWIGAVSARLLPFHGCRSALLSDRAQAGARRSSIALHSASDFAARCHRAALEAAERLRCASTAAPAVLVIDELG